MCNCNALMCNCNALLCNCNALLCDCNAMPTSKKVACSPDAWLIYIAFSLNIQTINNECIISEHYFDIYVHITRNGTCSHIAYSSYNTQNNSLNVYIYILFI